MAEIFMAGILLTASFLDGRTKKIPNWLNGLGVLPVAWVCAEHGSVGGILMPVLSMMLVFAICWNIYLLQGLGAGDCKLLILLAGLCGLSRLLYIAVIAFSLAGLFGLAKVFFAVGSVSGIKEQRSFLPLQSGRARDAIWNKNGEKHKVILAPFLTVGYMVVMFGRW